MSKVTIFPDAYNSEKPFVTSVNVIHDRIKSNKYQSIIEQIRSIPDKKARDNKKKSLPSILFSGIFTKRLNEGIQEHSGLICIDFDKLGDRYEEVKQMLIEDAHTHLLFVSPSGNGLKCVFKIPPSILTHADSARAIREYFKHEPSYDHFADVARICFISHDPNIYYNPTSSVFEQMIEAPKPVFVEVTEIVSDYDQIYNNLKKWLETTKFENYEDGNKHKFLVKFAGACNRFGMPRPIALGKLEYDYLNAAGQVKREDFEKIVNKVYNNYQSQHGISFFDRTQKVFAKAQGTKSTFVQVPEFEFPEYEYAKDVIYVSHVRPQIIDIYENGLKQAESTHYRTIDQHWKWKPGEISLMTGIMNHGKSTLILQLMLIRSVFDKVKWAIFSPEQNPPHEFYMDLAHTYLGKYPNKGFTNSCSRSELNDALDFLDEHFYFIYPEKDAPTPEYINDRFMEVIVKHDIKGCLIDPFNQLDNDIKKYGGREDLYISAFAYNLKRFTLDQNLYTVVNAHPNSGVPKIKDTHSPYFGNYDCPDVFDLAGGAMWGNKFDNILATHRPFYSTDPTNTLVHFVSKKIKKQKIVGIPGTVELKFNRMTNRYYEEGDRCPLPAPYFDETPNSLISHDPYKFLNERGETPPF